MPRSRSLSTSGRTGRSRGRTGRSRGRTGRSRGRTGRSRGVAPAAGKAKGRATSPRRATGAAPAGPDPATRRRARAILARLTKAYPDWGPTLEFRTPLDLLVATILAAQARDERINEVTRQLFERYRTPEDWLRVPQAKLEREIRSTGFFRQKAKAIKGACQGIMERFRGRVPSDIASLTELPGVGRKTAALVVGAAFGVPAVAVDRHVERVAGRLGLARPGQDGTEEGLQAAYPKKDWVRVTWTFILHGRRTCMPTPACPRCPVLDLCPYPNKTKN